MNVYILEANYERAKEVGAKMVGLTNDVDVDDERIFSLWNAFDCNDNELLSEQFNIGLDSSESRVSDCRIQREQLFRLRFNFIQVYMGLGEYSNALILAIKLYHEIKQLDFNYEHMTCCLLIAKILVTLQPSWISSGRKD